MNWAHPNWLWLFLIVPVYFLLSLFTFAYPERSVASLLLWKQVQSHRAAKTSGKPATQYWITALLLSTLLSGIILSLAGPFSWSSSRTTSVRFLLDLSASMNTREPDGERRYDHAIENLEQFAGRMPDHTRWKLTLLKQVPETITGSPGEILNQLRLVEPSDLPQHVVSEHIRSFLSNSEEKQVYLITDDVNYRSLEHERVTVLPVGTPQPNGGVTTLYGRREEGRLSLYAGLNSFGQKQGKGVVKVFNGQGQLLQEKQVTIETGNRRTIHLDIPDWNESETGRLEFTTDGRDALSTDDRAYFSTIKPYRLRVHVYGNNNEIANMLDTISGVEPASNPGKAQVDLYRSPAPEQSIDLWNGPIQKSTIVIAPTFPDDNGPRLKRIPEINQVIPADHPITANVPISGVKFRNAVVLPNQNKTRSDERLSIPLIRSRKGALAILKKHPAHVLWMFNDPFYTRTGSNRTNWSISSEQIPSFVMFWQNVFQFLNPWHLRRYGDLVYWKTGQLPLTADRYHQIPDRFQEQSGVGMHQLDTDSVSGPVPMNLLEVSETNTMTVPKRTKWQPRLPESGAFQQKQSHVDRLSIMMMLGFIGILVSFRILHGNFRENR